MASDQQRALATLDAATAARLPDGAKLRLTKRQLLEIANYNAGRIRRILRSRQELNVEIAGLKLELAQVARERAEAAEAAAGDEHYRQSMALSRMKGEA